MINSLLGGNKGFPALVDIVHRLRSPGGCPWDMEQTNESIKGNVLEEAYELYEAISLEDDSLIIEELGDVLLQVVFHAEIAGSSGRFTLEDVIDGICNKLIERHPHVFSDTNVSGVSEVLSNWEQIKNRSKKHTSKSDTLKAVSSALPALMRAEKIISRAKKAGYIFSEEKTETDDIGDKLFTLALEAKALGVDPELALLDKLNGFIKDFEAWEMSQKQANSP